MQTVFKNFKALQESLYGMSEAEKRTRKEENMSDNVKMFVKPQNTRSADDRAEREFTAFLENNIYPGLVKIGLAFEINTVNTKGKQCNGCDAIYHTVNGYINVDNKNRASVINKRSRGIPLELATDNKKGERMTGWFLDEEKETDYIFSTHCFTRDSSQSKFNNISMNDITDVDIYIYKLDDIKHYLKVLGISLDDIKMQSQKLEETFKKSYSEQDAAASRRQAINKHTFIYTSYYSLKENPTVLLIDESVIRALPNTRHFLWNEKFGLKEDLNKMYRPELTQSHKKGRPVLDDLWAM